MNCHPNSCNIMKSNFEFGKFFLHRTLTILLSVIEYAYPGV